MREDGWREFLADSDMWGPLSGMYRRQRGVLAMFTAWPDGYRPEARVRRREGTGEVLWGTPLATVEAAIQAAEALAAELAREHGMEWR